MRAILLLIAFAAAAMACGPEKSLALDSGAAAEGAGAYTFERAASGKYTNTWSNGTVFQSGIVHCTEMDAGKCGCTATIDQAPGYHLSLAMYRNAGFGSWDICYTISAKPMVPKSCAGVKNFAVYRDI